MNPRKWKPPPKPAIPNYDKEWRERMKKIHECEETKCRRGDLGCGEDPCVCGSRTEEGK